MSTQQLSRWLVVLVLVLAGTLAGRPAGAVAGQVDRPGAQRAPAQCVVPTMNVTKGRLEGAAGSRFLTVRVLNLSDRRCATPGWTRYRFAHARPLGFRSLPNRGFDPGKPPVVIPAHRVARSVLSWVSPAVVDRADCRPRLATRVRLRLAGVPGVWTVRIHQRVCTTERFRPTGTRIHVRRG
jgi:hypothetical protein